MMSEKTLPVNGGIAQLRNVALCYQAVVTTQAAHPLAPKLVAMCGRSGDGKTQAATFVRLRTNAYYVAAKSCWSKKHFLECVLFEMGIPAFSTTSKMVDQISIELAKSRRPLIIDEFDHLVTTTKVEMVRDIYEGCQSTILLIGEELLPRKLEKWERFHSRVLNWVQAMPANIDDARLLTPIYAPKLTLADDALAELVRTVKGSTRRISTNLSRIYEVAMAEGLKSVDMATLKSLKFEFVTGESPKPRTF